jgi:WD40 repeat protein
MQDGWQYVKLVDLQTAIEIRRFGAVMGIRHVSLSPNGKWLAMTGQQGLRLLDVATGKVLLDQSVDFDIPIRGSRIKWNSDGTIGATAGQKYVYMWSMREPKWLARFPHVTKGDRPDVALSPDGHKMAASDSGSATLAYWPDLTTVLPQNQLSTSTPK